MVADSKTISETDIKIRFNNLCRQFERNEKYVSLEDDQTIPEDEDISHEMLIHNKRYQASFYQKIVVTDDLKNELKTIAETEEKDFSPEQFDAFIDACTSLPGINKSVWFMIDEHYGKYRILMYYDNVHNQADGEDL